jgi:hypothetical protein
LTQDSDVASVRSVASIPKMDLSKEDLPKYGKRRSLVINAYGYPSCPHSKSLHILTMLYRVWFRRVQVPPWRVCSQQRPAGGCHRRLHVPRVYLAQDSLQDS